MNLLNKICLYQEKFPKIFLNNRFFENFLRTQKTGFESVSINEPSVFESFAISSLDVIGRLFSVIVALPGHLLYRDIFYTIHKDPLDTVQQKPLSHTASSLAGLFVYCSKDTFSTLQKHVNSNILKISPPKTESFQIKILIFFHISAQSRNKKNNVYPCKPKFYYIKVGFKGVKIH